MNLMVADLGGGPIPHAPFSVIFILFLTKIMPNNRLAPSPLGLAPSLGSPGSATELNYTTSKLQLVFVLYSFIHNIVISKI